MFQTIDPRNSQVIKQYNYMEMNEIEQIIDSAHSSGIEWRLSSIAHRRSLMEAFADLLERHTEELASLISSEMGKLNSEAVAEVKKCAFLARHCAQHIVEWLTPKSLVADGIKHLVKLEPIGVTLSIMPWNFPFWQVLRAAIPSILGGNVILLKPAESTTGCGLRLQQLFLAAGFPSGVFQTIICSHQQAAVVIAHQHIRLVSFTGSCRAGREIGKVAGHNLKKCILELGGSDPFLVLEDADLDKVISGALIGRFLNAGQVCISSKRFIVHQKIAAEFTRRFVESVKELKIAPLINQRAIAALDLQVKQSIAQGATLLCGGKSDDKNLYYPPTVLSDVTNSMPVCQEEVFGPVAPILVAQSVEEMIDLANDSEFGLGALVWGEDRMNAEKVAEQIECGAVFVNSFVKSDPRVPFGGIKNSGFGVEMTEYGLYEVMNLKSYNIY